MSHHRAPYHAVHQKILRYLAALFRAFVALLSCAFPTADQRVVPVQRQHAAQRLKGLRLQQRHILRGQIALPPANQDALPRQLFHRRGNVPCGKAVKILCICRRQVHLPVRKPRQHPQQGFGAGDARRVHIREHLVKQVPAPVPFAVELVLKHKKGFLQPVQRGRDLLHQQARHPFHRFDVQRAFPPDQLPQQLRMLRGLIGPAVQAGKQLHLYRLHKPDVPVLEPPFHQNALPLAPAVVFHVVKIRALHQARRLPEPVPVYVQPRRKVPVQRIVLCRARAPRQAMAPHAQRRNVFHCQHPAASPVPPPVRRFCSMLSQGTRQLHVMSVPQHAAHAKRPAQSRSASARGSARFYLFWMASTALMTAARIPPRSSSATPTMVVPPGEHTASFIAPGWAPVSTCMRPVPATIWPARR